MDKPSINPHTLPRAARQGATAGASLSHIVGSISIKGTTTGRVGSRVNVQGFPSEQAFAYAFAFLTLTKRQKRAQ